jgi:hypothetical protein
MAESTAPPLATFDPPTRLSLILDLSPEQWELSASSFQSESPLAFDEFISQVLAFVNAHLAGKHENTITILGAFPGKRRVLLQFWRSLLALTFVVYLRMVLIASCCTHLRKPHRRQSIETPMYTIPLRSQTMQS